MNNLIKPAVGDILLHKKGVYYRVLLYSIHSESQEVLITYENLKTKETWSRPKSMFTTDRFTIAITAEDLNS